MGLLDQPQGQLTLTGNSFNPDTGRGLYGTGDTGQTIQGGSKGYDYATAPTAQPEESFSYPKSHIYEMPAAAATQPEEVYTMEKNVVVAEQTYKPQQSTEQEVPPEPAVEQAEVAPSIEEFSEPVQPETISVVDEYDWTLSINKEQLIDRVPRIILTEFNITASNVMQSLYAGLMAWSDLRAANAAGVRAVGGVISNIGGDAINAVGAGGAVTDIKKFLDDNKDSKLGNYMRNVGNAPGEMADKAINYAKSKFSRSAPSFGPGGNNLVSLYGDIYARKATGKTYMLPYFTSEYLSISNQFRDSYEHLSNLGKMIDNVVEAFEQIPALVEPGVYVQRPQFYQFKSQNTAEHSIKFNLFNTVTPMAYMQNAAFIQKLALSNMPRRKSRVVVDPPCIYEVLIPGKAFHPYCYIQSLNVTHLGTKRMIGGEAIPDAYEIDIKLVSLLSEASNFYDGHMQHHGLSLDQHQSVNTSTNALNNLGSMIGSDVGNLAGTAMAKANEYKTMFEEKLSKIMNKDRATVQLPTQNPSIPGVKLGEQYDMRLGVSENVAKQNIPFGWDPNTSQK